MSETTPERTENALTWATNITQLFAVLTAVAAVAAGISLIEDDNIIGWLVAAAGLAAAAVCFLLSYWARAWILAAASTRQAYDFVDGGTGTP